MIADLFSYIASWFKKLTPLQAVANELAGAEHELLRAESSAEYAQAVVTYNKNRIKRLRAHIAILNETPIV